MKWQAAERKKINKSYKLYIVEYLIEQLTATYSDLYWMGVGRSGLEPLL